MDTQISLEELQEKLLDRNWRLNNLYFIKDEGGNKVQFKMNEVQRDINDNLWFFNIIPKARQLGVTTFFCIFYLDQILFSKNKTAGIIAHRQEDMKKIFKSKIKFAWDNLHPFIKEKIGEPISDSAYELSFPNGSNIFVSLTTRSGTVQFLHISEFGYICQKFPEKAEEIVTGAINSVHAGQMVSIESTAAGREGYFYDFTMIADRLAKEGRELSELDWRLFFYPWYIDPRYVLEANFLITKEDQEYFYLLEKQYGIKLADNQKRWYIKKKELNQEKMFAEYPSTLEEAFSVSQEGSYYSKEMSRVYLTRRIQPLAYDSNVPVDTWWDLGMNDLNVILFVQLVGTQIRFLDMYVHSGEGLKHYVDIMAQKREEKGWRYGTHYLPHDVEVRDISTGISRKQTLWNLGLKNVVVSPKTGILEGIDRVRGLFGRFVFDEANCRKLYESLQNYRKDYDQNLGQYKDKPKHDENSHIADAVRTGALKYIEPIIGGEYDMNTLEREQAFFG